MSFIIGLFIGLWLGAVFGFFTAALLHAGRDADRMEGGNDGHAVL